MKKTILLKWQEEMLEKMKKDEDITFSTLPRRSGKTFFIKFLIRNYPEIYIKYFIK